MHVAPCASASGSLGALGGRTGGPESGLSRRGLQVSSTQH